MTLTIDLTPEEEARLAIAARKEGVAPPECAKRVLTAHLPPLRPGDATLALFASWEAEDGTDDPEELATRNGEWEELKRGMNGNRAATGEEPLFGG
jgi:hypothetical protein